MWFKFCSLFLNSVLCNVVVFMIYVDYLVSVFFVCEVLGFFFFVF